MSCVIIYLALPSPAASSDPPENVTGSHMVFYSVLLRMRFTWTLPVTRKAVVSYTAFPPLPVAWRFISVALSLESPPPDVIRHPALRSPDFPHLTPFGSVSRDYIFCLPCNFITVFSVCPAKTTTHCLPLYTETAVPHKFPENRILRYILCRNPKKIIQKLQKALRFLIFRVILCDLEQKRFRIDF